MNSAHQLWSKWTFTVTPQRHTRSVDVIRDNCARFGRKAFGSAAEMRITVSPLRYVIEVRAEGHPVHDPTYRQWMIDQWTLFFVRGCGPETRVECATVFESGDRQDGTPPDQVLMLPSLQVTTKLAYD